MSSNASPRNAEALVVVAFNFTNGATTTDPVGVPVAV